jgi:short-subunit dehydrogenase
VLITGATSGLGEELAYQLSNKGVKKLIFASRNIKEMQRVRDHCCKGGNQVEVYLVQIDLGKPEECLERL